MEKESTEFELGWVRYCRYKVGCLINFKNELDNVWVLHGFKNELVCCFCVWGLETYLVLLVKALHQVVFVLEFEEGSTLVFAQVLHVTGLTGHPNWSDWLKVLFSIVSVGPVGVL